LSPATSRKSLSSLDLSVSTAFCCFSIDSDGGLDQLCLNPL